MEDIKEPDIPVVWIYEKFIWSGKYRGTITETGAKVILRYWKEYCDEQYRREHPNRGR